MKRHRTTVSRAGCRDRGATAVEYGLVVALLILAILMVAATVGQQVFHLYTTVPAF